MDYVWYLQKFDFVWRLLYTYLYNTFIYNFN